MKPSKIFSILDMAKRANNLGMIFNPLFVGAPGLGKTEIVEQWCKEKDYPYITLTSALLEAPEIRGFPVVGIKDGKQKMSTAIPDFWPESGEGVIILEEVNRGQNSVMNCWMALTDKRRGFDNYKLPPGWIVVGCINPETSEYDVNTMDPALKDRFEIFQVDYDKESFLSYMKKSVWDEQIVSFVENNLWNYLPPEDVKNVVGAKYIAPRTMSKLNAARRATFDLDDELLVYTSILGNNVGRDFYAFLYNERPVFYSDIKNDTKNALSRLKKFCDPKNFKSGMISLTIKDILETSDITDELLVQVLGVIPVEQSTHLLERLIFKRNDKTFLKTLFKKHPEIKENFKAVLDYGK